LMGDRWGGLGKVREREREGNDDDSRLSRQPINVAKNSEVLTVGTVWRLC
jgi:hypothetical protein